MKKLDHLVNKSFVLLQVLKENKELNAVQKSIQYTNNFEKSKNPTSIAGFLLTFFNN